MTTTSGSRVSSPGQVWGESSRSRLLALALIVLVSWPANPAGAQVLCCASQSCQSVANPGACAAASGIEGFCDLGLACSATCNPSSPVGSLANTVRVVRSGAAGRPDARLSWQVATNADRYGASFVDDVKATVGTTCGGAGWSPVPPNGISTVAGILHVNAVPGTSSVRFYCAAAACGALATTGSCCVGRNCTVTAQSACTGTWTAAGVCLPNPCTTTGSCCVGNTCNVTEQSACAGTWTAGGVCLPNPCTTTGSCCLGTNCTVTQQSACAGIWKAGGTCLPNPCLDTGACCLTAQPCREIQQADCAGLGGIFKAGIPCTPDPCGATGACCIGNIICADATESQCFSLSGLYSPGKTCPVAGCGGPQDRACCTPGLPIPCVVVDPASCPSLPGGGTPKPQMTCLPNPC